MSEYQLQRSLGGGAVESDHDLYDSAPTWCDTENSIWNNGLQRSEKLLGTNFREYRLLVGIVDRAFLDLGILAPISMTYASKMQPWAQPSAWEWLHSDSEEEWSCKWCLEKLCLALGGSPKLILQRARIVSRAAWDRQKDTRSAVNVARAEELEKLICEVFKVRKLRTRHKYSKVVHARNYAMYIMKFWFGESYPQVGSFFKRDHSSVIHAVRKFGFRDLLRDEESAVLLEVVKRFPPIKMKPVFLDAREKQSDREDWDYVS